MTLFLQTTFILSVFFLQGTFAWVTPLTPSTKTRADPLHMALKIGKNYTPKWKKLETLSDKAGDATPQDKGLTGTIPVVFKCGSTTLTTLASPGDAIRDAATQAGQYIKYGCGKGNCGTCQAMCNGKYINPCVALVPGDIVAGEEYVIQVKEIKNKGRSSGKFYSARSFLMGFYNNAIGMIGFVRTRRAANQSLTDRLEFEEMIARKAAEKRAARLAAQKVESQ